MSLELQELNEADFDLSLTGFDPSEMDGLLAIPDEQRANAGRHCLMTQYPGWVACGFAVFSKTLENGEF